MLIDLRFSNFLSFKDETEFSMLKGSQHIHKNHIIPGALRGLNLVKMAAVYGGNASGKSNFILAMVILKNLVTLPRASSTGLELRKFKLDKKSNSKPQNFEIIFQTSMSRVFKLRISLNDFKVIKESLTLIRQSIETVIYERVWNGEGYDYGKIKLDVDDELNARIGYIAQDTRSNQLFLSALVERNIDLLKDAYEWFSKQLVIVRPESHHSHIPFFIGDDKFIKKFTTILSGLDTGIECIKLVKVNVAEAKIPPEVMQNVKDALHNSPKEGDMLMFAMQAGKSTRYSFKLDVKGEILAFKLITQHKDSNGKLIDFELYEESSGTQRLFDIIPFLIEQNQGNNVLFVDELSRSLHPDLSISLIKNFLESETGSSQLIMATHESELLKPLLRRDEIWFVDKKRDQGSYLHSLEDSGIRNDLDVLRSYRAGRFGGRPIIRQSMIAGYE